MARSLAALLGDGGEGSLQRHPHPLEPVTVGLMTWKHWCRCNSIILASSKAPFQCFG